MKYRIRNIGDAVAWDAFVQGFNRYSITHSYAWGQLKHSFGWGVRRFWIEDDNIPIAGAQILLKKIPFIGGTLAYIPRGVLVDYEDGEKVSAICDAIIKVCRDEKVALLKTEPMTGINTDLASYTNAGFNKTDKGVQPKQTLVLDLTRSEEELLAAMNRRTRYNVRLATKKGVKFISDNSSQHLDQFYQLLEQTSERKQFLSHNKAYYDRMLELFGDSVRIFLSEYEGQIISGAFILTYGKYAYYSYGASRREHSNTKSTQGQQWEAIRYAKEHGFEVYDFWGVPDEPPEDHPLYGVYKFKLGFGGKLERYAGAYDMTINPARATMLQTALKLQGMMRNLTARGTLSDPMGN